MPTVRPHRRRAIAGFTLIEMMLVVTIVGIVVLMAMPRIEQALVRRDLAGARAATATLILQAKASAVQRRRPVTLSIDSMRAVLTAPTPSGVRHIALVHIKSSFGVATSSSAGSITVQPTGLIATGTPFTVRFYKGSQSDSVRVTGYGRVQ
jgi:prepilin-type N-terminal cleavage/methylation domain-containing protein